MRNNHTPGPWQAVPEGHRLSVWAEGYGFVHTTEVPQVNTHATETANANARLIAAAPELLEACRAVWNTPYDANPDQFQATRNLVKAAIAKAEGGTI